MLARPGAGSKATVVLPVVASAVTTGILLTLTGVVRHFWNTDDEYALVFRDFIPIMVGLLTIPLATLGGAAARLSARRRDSRLATLRLLGATTLTITAITVVEATTLALIGVTFGVILHVITLPLLGLVPFHGATFGGEVFWAGPWGILVVLLGVAALSAGSALNGLRPIVISPLGVRTKQTAPRTSRWRPVLGSFMVLVAFFAVLAGSHGAGVIFLVIAFSGATAVLGVVGPWSISIFARGQLRRARSAAQLLAARTILESPRTAWRLVGGVAMTSFIAVIGGSGIALVGTFSGRVLGPTFVPDFRTGIITTLAASFIMVACAVGVAQAAAILDRRDLYVSLDRLGTPINIMDRARVHGVVSPLLFVTIGSTLLGVIIALPLMGFSLLLAPESLIAIAICLVAGVLLVRAALLATRPVLQGVLRRPERSLG
ncbi:permease [Pseudoclavibacter sp. VKM Ac-2888]|nr:permease [Pseudoclavibacter sp. VKM Ac-2888]